MKTIAVSDKAYSRLASWKTGSKDTFSGVIERLIPAKGTLSAVLAAAESLPDLTPEAADALEAQIGETRKLIPSPWS